MSGYDDRRQEEKPPGPGQLRCTALPSTPGVLPEPQPAGEPGGARCQWSKHGPGDSPRFGERGRFPLRPGDSGLLKTSSHLFPHLFCARKPGGETLQAGAGGQCPPPAKLSDWGSPQRALTPIEKPRRWCVCVSIHRGALRAQTLPLLFLFAGHPSPTPICFCQMRKSPRKTQTLQRPRAPFGTWQHAAAGSSAQLGARSSVTQLSGLLGI